MILNKGESTPHLVVINNGQQLETRYLKYYQNAIQNKVEDQFSYDQLLMINFYKNWISMGDKHKAFREAQIQLMKVYKEPYFWGAFVMIGE